MNVEIGIEVVPIPFLGIHKLKFLCSALCPFGYLLTLAGTAPGSVLGKQSVQYPAVRVAALRVVRVLRIPTGLAQIAQASWTQQSKTKGVVNV
jgi:hypothetical protein